jgi:hypothetical protein
MIRYLLHAHPFVRRGGRKGSQKYEIIQPPASLCQSTPVRAARSQLFSGRGAKCTRCPQQRAAESEKNQSQSSTSRSSSMISHDLRRSMRATGKDASPAGAKMNELAPGRMRDVSGQLREADSHHAIGDTRNAHKAAQHKAAESCAPGKSREPCNLGRFSWRSVSRALRRSMRASRRKRRKDAGRFVSRPKRRSR